MIWRVAMLVGEREGVFTHCSTLTECYTFINDRMGGYYDGARITIVKD